MEDKDTIKRHYNKMQNKSIVERRQSPSINIRDANNFIKSALFKMHISRANKVLDIGFGSGGDLKKYQLAEVSEVYGLDIANKRILDALKRARTMSIDFKLILKVKDCFSNELNLKRQFDIVSCQFTFHYCFESEKNVEIALDNIARHLKCGGRVLLTIPSKQEILRRKRSEQLSNRFYNIEFKNESDSIYGASYYYSLIDSVNECVEYLVDMDALTTKAKEKGLEVVSNITFENFFDDSCKSYPEMYRRMVKQDLSLEEREVVYLYHIVVLRKLGIPGS